MTIQATAGGGLDVPVLDVDPFSDAILANPVPFFDRLRDIGPVAYIPVHNMYAVGRYDEARTVLSDYPRFTSAGSIGLADIRKPGVGGRPPGAVVDVDPPKHTENRAALTKILSPIVVRKWKESFEGEAAAVIDRALAKGTIDGVVDIVESFVLKVFPDALGVEMPREYFRIYGDLNFNLLGPMNERTKVCERHAGDLVAKFPEFFDRKAMRPGGFGDQLYQAEDRGEFAKGNAAAHARTFIRAGVDTTIASIGYAILFFAKNPDVWAAVKADPTKVKNAFEEAMRLESPAIVMFRTTTGEVDLSGYRLKADTKIGCYLGAANRDSRKFENPEMFDINRDVAGVHLAFGYGHHICLGQMTARAEAEAILTALVKKVKRIELLEAPRERIINVLHTLDNLPIRLIAE